jgi:hypothetical protein
MSNPNSKLGGAQNLPDNPLTPQHRTMILIQCTNSKRSEAAKAKNLYDESDYFRKMRKYAEATGEMWFILSAKHGLVDPETVIEPYDAFGLSEDQAKEIATEVAQQTEYVEIIAGKKYTNPLTPELEKHGIDVLELCRGMGIGERKQNLNQKTAALVNQSL